MMASLESDTSLVARIKKLLNDDHHILWKSSTNTAILLLIFTIVGYILRFSVPVQCLVHGGNPGNYDTFAKKQCSVGNTFTEETFLGNDVLRSKPINVTPAYKWIPEIFMTLSVVTMLPVFAAVSYTCFHFEYSDVIANCRKVQAQGDPEVQRSMLEQTAMGIQTARDILKEFRVSVVIIANGMATIMALASALLMLMLLSNGDLLWPVHILQDITARKATLQFPIVTFCKMTFETTGNKQSDIIQCVTKSNMFHAFMFVFALAWLLGHSLLSAYKTWQAMSSYVSKQSRRAFYRSIGTQGSVDSVIAEHTLGGGGIFLLQLLISQCGGNKILAQKILKAVVSKKIKVV